jgi:heat shock protein 5
MSEEKILVGIDLGTTNTCVCIAKKTAKGVEFEVVENLIGKRTTPSVVCFTEDGEEVVGQLAKAQQAINPERTVYGAKRLIGHKYGDEEINKLFSSAPFKIIYNEDDDPVISIPAAGADKAREYRPEQISAMVLGEVVKIVKNKTGRAPDECIITVPAYFNDMQRQSTLIAAKIAGLNVNRLVNEPTAAAIAFQNKVKFNNGRVLVFDFGGGTLDVSILEVKDNKFIVKAVSGDTALGGEDIDAILMEEMISRFKKAYPDLDPRDNKRSMANLKIKCEEAKCQLSSATEARVAIGSFFQGKDLNEKITRARFNFICDDSIFSKITDPIDEALEEAHLSAEDIDQIILVGGSSHIPAVNDAVTEYFDGRIKPLTAVNVDEAVAIGATIICHKANSGKVILDESEFNEKIKKGEVGGEDEGLICMIDVQPVSIGIKNGKSTFQKFINRNKILPQTNEFFFATTKDNQRFANIEIFQGEDSDIDLGSRSHINLGKFKLTGLPRAKAGEIVMRVKMTVDVSGVLHVTADCKDSAEKEKTLDINFKEILSSDEMKAAIKEQNDISERKELQLEYNKLLSKLYDEISRIRGEGKDTRGWDQQYKNFSSNVSKTKEGLQSVIDMLKKTIEKVKTL